MLFSFSVSDVLMSDRLYPQAHQDMAVIELWTIRSTPLDYQTRYDWYWGYPCKTVYIYGLFLCCHLNRHSFIATVKVLRTLLIAQNLDVGAGLFKLLVIEHICHSLRGVAIPAPT